MKTLYESILDIDDLEASVDSRAAACLPGEIISKGIPRLDIKSISIDKHTLTIIVKKQNRFCVPLQFDSFNLQKYGIENVNLEGVSNLQNLINLKISSKDSLWISGGLKNCGVNCKDLQLEEFDRTLLQDSSVEADTVKITAHGYPLDENSSIKANIIQIEPIQVRCRPAGKTDMGKSINKLGFGKFDMRRRTFVPSNNYNPAKIVKRSLSDIIGPGKYEFNCMLIKGYRGGYIIYKDSNHIPSEYASYITSTAKLKDGYTIAQAPGLV